MVDLCLPWVLISDRPEYFQDGSQPVYKASLSTNQAGAPSLKMQFVVLHLSVAFAKVTCTKHSLPSADSLQPSQSTAIVFAWRHSQIALARALSDLTRTGVTCTNRSCGHAA